MIPQNRAWARRVYRRRCKAYATSASAAGLDPPTYAQQMRDKVTNWIYGYLAGSEGRAGVDPDLIVAGARVRLPGRSVVELIQVKRGSFWTFWFEGVAALLRLVL